MRPLAVPIAASDAIGGKPSASVSLAPAYDTDHSLYSRLRRMAMRRRFTSDPRSQPCLPRAVGCGVARDRVNATLEVLMQLACRARLRPLAYEPQGAAYSDAPAALTPASVLAHCAGGTFRNSASSAGWLGRRCVPVTGCGSSLAAPQGTHVGTWSSPTRCPARHALQWFRTNSNSSNVR